MKKIVSLILSLLLLLAFPNTIFANEIKENENISIYASEKEASAVINSMEKTKAKLSLSEYKIFIDKDTIMPVYYASLLNFAKTGKFSYERYVIEGKQLYISDTVSADNKFSGVILFTEDDILMYKPSTISSDSIDFVEANSKRISDLTGKKIESLVKTSLFMFVEGAGYVYYIDNGENKSLIAANFKGTNGYLFTNENRGIVNIDNDLFSFAKKLIEEQEAAQKYLSTLKPGENPPTGAAVPAFIADNDYKSLSLTKISIVFFIVSVFSLIGYFFASKHIKTTKT